jgi:hypothetical protein
LEGQFTKPVFVGDALVVKLCDTPELRSVQFQVMNEESGTVVMNRGYVEYEYTIKNSPESAPRLKPSVWFAAGPKLISSKQFAKPAIDSKNSQHPLNLFATFFLLVL